MASAPSTESPLPQWRKRLRAPLIRKNNPSESLQNGQAAEIWLSEAFTQRGYTIVKRNYRRIGCEVDLILCKGDLLRVIEVKLRKHPIDAAFISGLQQKTLRIHKALGYFIAEQNRGNQSWNVILIECWVLTRNDTGYKVTQVIPMESEGLSDRTPYF